MLDEQITKLAQGQNYAAVTTLLSDGTPQTKPLWVDTDGEHILINTEVHRRGFKNLQRDPRVTVAIIDHENPYKYVEVRGHVVETVTGPEARAHIDQLSQRYLGQDYGGKIETERVIVKVAPDYQFVR
ncbi:MAG TPA: TIGR03618 family F420-dependent PPOX class oxidoreductase [Acidimicrobiales bacterium]|nr:TIGR03618 family F420-dependent PPOX class oxidoreductase [Acidimicrobiales bacterium]